MPAYARPSLATPDPAARDGVDARLISTNGTNLVMYRLAQPQNYVIQGTRLSRDHRTSRFVVKVLRNNDD